MNLLAAFMYYARKVEEDQQSQPQWRVIFISESNMGTRTDTTSSYEYITETIPNIQAFRITGSINASMGTKYYSSSDRSFASCGSKSVSRTRDLTGTASEVLTEEEITVTPDTATELFYLSATTYGTNATSTASMMYYPTTGEFKYPKTYSGLPYNNAQAYASIGIRKIEAYY